MYVKRAEVMNLRIWLVPLINKINLFITFECSFFFVITVYLGGELNALTL